MVTKEEKRRSTADRAKLYVVEERKCMKEIKTVQKSQ
jgi:hypothetical protein